MKAWPLAALLLLALAASALAQTDKEPKRPPTPDATIAVTSDPPGARVYVGSEGGGSGMFYKGVSPVSVTIVSAQAEAVQRYRVTLVLPGYDSYTRVLEVRKGDALQVTADMDPRAKRCYVEDDSIVVENWEGERRKVVAPIGIDFSFESMAWSPNGRYLAYAQMGELFIADISWREQRQVTDVRGQVATGELVGDWVYESPLWAADGRHLVAIQHSEKESRLMIVPVRITAPDDLPGGEGEAGDLPLEMLGGGGPQVEAPIEVGREFACVDAWRPGARSLAAQTQLFNDAAEPYSQLMLILLDPEWRPFDSAVRVSNAGQAAWSADGSRLAYTYYDMATRSSILYVGDGNGNASTPLVQMPRARIRKPLWAPDGEHLAYLVEDRTDGQGETIVVLPVADAEGAVEVWSSRDRQFDEEAIRLIGFTPDGREVVFARGAPAASFIYAVPVSGGAERLLLPNRVAAFAYSSGLPSELYRSLETFRTHLLNSLEALDIATLGELCLPVLEKCDGEGKMLKEMWEEDRASALAEILRNTGPSGVANASQTAYPGKDGRFEQVLQLGGSGRKLFLVRSDGRWYVGGFYIAP
jgi:hypothetical protein